MRDRRQKPADGHVLRMTQLARELGVHISTIKNYLTDPTHPQKHEGGWDISECRAWYIAKGVVHPGDAGELAKALARKTLAEADKEEARAKILNTKARKDLAKLLPTEEVEDQLTATIGECMAQLRTVPDTLAPQLANCTPEQAAAKVRDGIDACLANLSNLPWLTDELKKKLQALGARSMTPSLDYFALPAASASSDGLAKTSDSTPASPAPDLIG